MRSSGKRVRSQRYTPRALETEDVAASSSGSSKAAASPRPPRALLLPLSDEVDEPAVDVDFASLLAEEGAAAGAAEVRETPALNLKLPA